MSIPSPCSNWPLLANFPQFIHWTWRSVVWNISLASLDQVSWPWALTASSVHLTDHGKLKSPQLEVSTTEQQLKFQCFINLILTVNTEQTTVTVTKKKTNSIPAEIRAGYKPFYNSSWGSHPEIFNVGKKTLNMDNVLAERKCHYWLDLASSLSVILIFLFLMLIQ